MVTQEKKTLYFTICRLKRKCRVNSKKNGDVCGDSHFLTLKKLNSDVLSGPIKKGH